MAGNTATPGATVTSRVLAILGAFDAGHRSLTLTEVAERAGLARPTAHRLLAELVSGDALRRDEQGSYTVGRRLWDLGLLAPVQTGLREAASPYLHDLYGATLATVHLAVRDGLQVLYLDRLAGHASVPVVSTIGSRLPLHATGVGKVLLAHAPAKVQAEALGRLTRVTPYTITQPGMLRRQLARTRREGYATTVEEMSLGACSVAVPIRRGPGPGAGDDGGDGGGDGGDGGDGDGGDGEVVAALGIVVPGLKKDRPRLVAALQVAAHGISRTLG